MRSRKREAIFMGIGVLAGLALSGPTAQAATSITATLSSQPIYVDGQRVAMTAYSIGGNNYVRLRDIGKAVDFGVTYDAATNSVCIDSTQPYYEEAASAPGEITEEAVQAILAGLRESYPHGSAYPAPYLSSSNGPYSVSSTNCAGWATLCSDAAFGNLPWRRVEQPSWNQIRAGDLIRYDTDTSGHVVVVVKKTTDLLYYTDSGTSKKVYWGGNVPRWWMEQQPGYTLYTRYPE